ncbi:MAG: hypothetical protein IBX43_00600 [Campylobacterales bacterium]|nr:hypothetical protein [Campylobacterales bacterium]
MKKLSLSLAAALQRLAKEKRLKGSVISDKNLLDALEENGVVRVQITGKRSRVIWLSDERRLGTFLKEYYAINDLDLYINAAQKDERSRSENAQASSDSKVHKTQVQSGLYIASFEALDISIDAQKTRLQTPSKSALFVHKSAALEIAEDILLVGVENFENLTMIQAQKTLFDAKRKKLFIYRNAGMLDFVAQCRNDYLHFGDFDLAGVHIYLNEVVPRLSHERHRFFIPEGIAGLLKQGSSRDYFMHSRKYPGLNSEEPYLQSFIDLLHQAKRSLHQEFLIGLNEEHL